MAYKYKSFVKVSRSNVAATQRLADIRTYYENMTFTQYKNHLQYKVRPEFKKILKKHGIREARKISRTGELASNIITGDGTATRGFPAVWLGAGGPAAAYASIINEGGWQKPRLKDYLTIPLDAAKDPSTGAKKKSVRDYPDKMTFLWDIPANRGGTWGRLAGQKVLFKKEKNFPLYGKGSRKKKETTFKRGKGSKGVHFHKITPIFIYAKENYVKPTYWASNAMKSSIPEVLKIIGEFNKNWAKYKKGGSK